MSNPEKIKVDDFKKEKDDSDEQWSDEESAKREIVSGLPALKISRKIVGVSSAVEEEEARLNEQAIVAAELVVSAADEAVMKDKIDGKKKKKARRSIRMTVKMNDEAGGSSKGGEAKKSKKKSSELTNPPKGPPVCNICGRAFRSWKAVFGHLRCHKDRNYQGFLPPPRFSAVAGGVVIPGPNSAFVLFSAGGGNSGGFVAATGGGSAPGVEGGRGVEVDLNVDPVEEEEQEVTECGSIAKFDLNKSPPKDEEEENKPK